MHHEELDQADEDICVEIDSEEVFSMKFSNSKTFHLVDDEWMEANQNEIKETIEKHIELEAKAIDTYRSLLKVYIEDEKVKMIISEIHKDEIRHHAFLTALLKTIVEKETLTKDMLEDWMFKYAPFHGSPGG